MKGNTVMADSRPTVGKQSGAPISIFQGRFLLTKLLGKGGFGEVYAGTQASTGEPIAVKLERNVGNNSFLFHEARVMQEIQRHPTADGLPAIATLRYFGQEGDYRILIMALQGPSLEDIHEKRRWFSLKTTIMIADQILSRLQHVHKAGYVHRDLKPDNFLTGLNEFASRIFLVDFGLSSRYITLEGNMREMQTGKNFVGTSRYASLRTHQGYSQGRRDDIEQLVYIMVYMYRGCLPWSGLPIKNRDEKERKIGEIKQRLDPAEICAKCPSQWTDLLYYARNMSFTEAPQYEMCHVLLQSILDEMNPPEKIDNQFDWLPTAGKVRPQISPPAANLVVPPLGNDEGQTGAPNVLSNAKGQGFFSGFGSGALSQDIMSLGEKY